MDRRKRILTAFDAYRDSLRLLGFYSYEEYLKSEYWSQLNQAYRSCTRLPQACLVCGSENVELHHIDYRQLGYEELWHVVPLCRVHHESLHRWLKETNGKVNEIRSHLVEYFGFSIVAADEAWKPFSKLRRKAEAKRRSREKKSKPFKAKQTYGIICR